MRINSLSSKEVLEKLQQVAERYWSLTGVKGTTDGFSAGILMDWEKAIPEQQQMISAMRNIFLFGKIGPMRIWFNTR